MKEDGSLLQYASEQLQKDKKLVEVAVKSNVRAIQYASKKLANDAEIKKIADSVKYDFLNGFDTFLKDNYGGLPVGPSGSRGYRIVNQGNFF